VGDQYRGAARTPRFAGQLTELAPAAAAAEGAIHFAGCGLSFRPGFMHGALASAHRVVDEIYGATLCDATRCGRP
jgi:monoamine oxidase